MQEIRDSLSCGNKKAISLLDELENKVNLIEQKRHGLGEPNLIYVKNFCNVDFPVERNFLKCQNDISVDVSKAHSNNTDISKTKYNDTDSFLSFLPIGRDGKRMNSNTERIMNAIFESSFSWSY